MRTIGGGSGGAVGVRAMRRLHNRKLGRAHPQLFAGLTVEAEEVSLLARLFRTSDEDASTRDNRAAVARTRQGSFPAHVFPLPPVKRRLVLTRNSVSIRAAKC